MKKSIWLASIVLAGTYSAAARPCDPVWTTVGTSECRFGVGVGISSIPPEVVAMQVFNGELYVSGVFSAVNTGTSCAGSSVTSFGVVKWTGVAWEAVGDGFNSRVNALAVYDNNLYAGGTFAESATSTTLNGIAVLVNDEWASVGGGVLDSMGGFESAFVDTLVPHNGKLFVGGTFKYAGSTSFEVNNIAAWDGKEEEWIQLGESNNYGVCAIDFFDECIDDPPQTLVSAIYEYQGLLFVGGSFDTAGGIETRFLARWDDSKFAWGGAGLGFSPPSGPTAVLCFAEFDAELYAGGSFNYGTGEDQVRRLIRLNNSSDEWEQVGGGVNGSVVAMQAFDSDGTGPKSTKLYITGSFTSVGPGSLCSIEYTNSLATWDGSCLQGFPDGLEESAMQEGLGLALCLFDEDGSGPQKQSLFVGGNFETVDELTVRNIARYREPAAPLITVQPVDTRINSTNTTWSASASVTATGNGTLAYQWYKDNSALTNDGNISGADTSSLLINGAGISDADSYYVVVTSDVDDCSVQSDTITIDFCLGDANGDGQVLFGDVSTVLFYLDLEADYRPGSGQGDADGNGLVEFADVTAVLSGLSNNPNCK